MYGILVSISILIPALLAERLVKKAGKDTNYLWSALLWMIIAGVIGARLYHVIDYWKLYSANPILILHIWNGGMGIFGALFGGVLAMFTFLHLKKEPVKPWLDIAAIVMPLGQAIGRWGNYFNMELFGPPTTLPWGIFVPTEKRPPGFLTFEKFHPLFLYESLLTLLLFAFLYTLYKNNRNLVGSGLFYALYFLGYSLVRFSLEFLRTDHWTICGANVAQMICIGLAAISVPPIYTVVKSIRNTKFGVNQ